MVEVTNSTVGVVSDRYRLEGTLGKGGFGTVYRATDLTLGRVVALKVLRADADDRTRAKERFFLEARATANFDSEHIPRIFDLGEFSSGQVFISMEFLHGVTLAEYVAERGPLSAGEAAAILVDVCRAVEVAHAANVVHRDLKPQNVFLCRRADGTTSIKVLDFGIARVLDAPGLTDDGAWLGTPRFMSPEQVGAPEEVGPATDLWALGVILYELVIGAPIFEAPTPAAHAAMLLTERAPSPRDKRADLPPAFIEIVERCLERDHKARLASATGLREALMPLATVRPTVAARSEDPSIAAMHATTVPHGPVPPVRSGASAAPSTKRPSVGSGSREGQTEVTVLAGEATGQATQRGGRGFGLGLAALGSVAAGFAVYFAASTLTSNDGASSASLASAPAASVDVSTTAPSPTSIAVASSQPSASPEVASAAPLVTVAASAATAASPVSQGSARASSTSAVTSAGDTTKIYDACITHGGASKVFLNDGGGPAPMQCQRIANLGCSGIKGVCFKEHDPVRKSSCRDFAGLLTSLQVCR